MSAKPVLAPLQTKRPASPLAPADGNVKTPVKEECLPLWSASLDRFSDCALPSPSECIRRDTNGLDSTPLVTEKYKAFLDAWKPKHDELATPSASPPDSRPVSAVIGSFNFSETQSPETTTKSIPPPTPMSATPASATSERFRYSLHFPPSPIAFSRAATTPRSATYPRPRCSDTPRSATPRSATGPGPFGAGHTVTTVTHTWTYKRTNFKRTDLAAPPKAKRRKHQENSDQKTE